LPAFKIGGGWRVSTKDLDLWCVARSEAHTPARTVLKS
jgi:hypothetical protein